MVVEKAAAMGKYLVDSGLEGKMANAFHLIRATGGNMVPQEEMQAYYEKRKTLL